MWQCPYKGMSRLVHNVIARLWLLLNAHTWMCDAEYKVVGAAYWNSQLIKDRTPVPPPSSNWCAKGRDISLLSQRQKCFRWRVSQSTKEHRQKTLHPPQHRAVLSIPPDHSTAEYSLGWAGGWKGREGTRRDEKGREGKLCLSAKAWDIEQAALPGVTISDRWDFKSLTSINRTCNPINWLRCHSLTFSHGVWAE